LEKEKPKIELGEGINVEVVFVDVNKEIEALAERLLSDS
jgi:hypothetical protein